MKQSITIKINTWIICAVLALTNLITVGLWQPWSNNTVSNRTIAITGTTTIQAEPDQYVFSTYYQKDGTDKATINNQLGDLSNTVIAKIKELGVKDSAIKTSAYTYDYGIYSQKTNLPITATLNLTITLNDRTLAQQVQDYLATTAASGTVTPQATFSTDKQKTLETQAREAAINDAKSKAEASAKQLGLKLGKVVQVSDSTSGGISPLPWLTDSSAKSSVVNDSSSSSYTIQPGLNDYSFGVNVTYELN